MTVQVDVAFLPITLLESKPTVAIVVDVIRASTSMVTLFDRGCPAIYVARTLFAGRAYARVHHMLLCGEEKGARPIGFDHGNSPTEFAARRFDRAPAVVCTTNGTVALHAVRTYPAVFVGCLANATAVVTAAVAEAQAVGTLTIVCAGSNGHVALDDVWTAGRLATRVTELLGSEAVPTDAATIAIALTEAMPDGLSALRASRSARALVSIGLDADVTYAAMEDRSAAVPRLVSRREEATYPVLVVGEESGGTTPPAAPR